MTDANDYQLEWAREQLGDVKRTLDAADDELQGYVASPSNSITQCQQCIKISAKSIFKLMGVNPPQEHDISLDHDQTKGLLNSEFPEYFGRQEKIPRVIFLTQFWHDFYETSKYGKEELNIPPNTLFTNEDAERAYKNAKECYTVADALKQTIEQQ